MILKNIFAQKLAKIGVFAQTTASFCKIWIITLVLEKRGNFFAENRQKSPKIAENCDQNTDPWNLYDRLRASLLIVT
jgi:hypothetical protein